MLDEAVECELQFAEDVLALGVAGLSIADMRQYLEFIADQRLAMLGMPKIYKSKNPFSFMDLQDVQELTNFFERRVSAYQLGVQATGLAPSQVLFVSCNAWDALAATWFGYRTLWVNRYQLPFEELGTQPTRTGSSLRDVLSFF